MQIQYCVCEMVRRISWLFVVRRDLRVVTALSVRTTASRLSPSAALGVVQARRALQATDGRDQRVCLERAMGFDTYALPQIAGQSIGAPLPDVAPGNGAEHKEAAMTTQPDSAPPFSAGRCCRSRSSRNRDDVDGPLLGANAANTGKTNGC